MDINSFHIHFFINGVDCSIYYIKKVWKIKEMSNYAKTQFCILAKV